MTRLIPALLLSLAMAACGVGAGGAGGAGGGSSNGTAGGPTGPVRPVDTTPAEKDMKVVNQPGVLVALDKVLVPGKVTVVDFFADWCGACEVMEKKLLEKVTGQIGIAIRKIDIKDDESPVAKHYEVGALPHVRIYTRSGQMVYALTGNQALRAGELALQVRERK